MFGKRVRPTIRFGTLDYLDPSDVFGRSPSDMDTKVLAVGFNYYITGNVVFKVEYDFVMEGPRATKKENNILALQAAIRF